MMFDRRTLLAGAAASLLPFGVRAAEGLPPLATPAAQRLVYDLSWIGVPVGGHEIVVTPDGPDGDFTVTNRAEIVVSLLFVDAIRFVHSSTEVWRNGLLHRFESETEDDGEFYEVTGAPDGDRFSLTSRLGTFTGPRDMLTNNDVWIPPVPGRRPIINTKKGEIVDVAVTPPATDAVRHDGTMVEVVRYDIASPVADGSLFYDGGLMLSGWFTRKGKTVDYSLANA